MSVEPTTPSVATIDSAIVTDPPIGKLPTELLLLVFYRCDPHLRDRIRLSHTCQRWRLIAISTSALWTRLGVNYYYTSESSPKKFNGYLALIRMQHDRAEGQLLDAHWAIHGEDEQDSRLLLLLDELDSFRRWRTLEVYFEPSPSGWYIASKYPNLNFSNMESLEVISAYLHPVTEAIDRTTTSKLKAIRMDSKDISPFQVDKYCSRMMEHASYLGIRTSLYKPMSPSVTKVFAESASIAHPNNVKSYTLFDCRFGTATLSHLTDLTVRDMIQVKDSCTVSLPALRNLDCMMVTLRGSATFDTPLLEKLELNSGRDMAAKMVIGSMPLYNDATYQQRASKDCLYVPLTRGELIIDRQWGITKLIKFLEWSPYAQRLSLVPQSDDHVRQVLEYLIERPHPQGVHGLTEIKIRGPYESGDLKSMAGLAERLVKRQREDLGVTLMIYGYEWMTGGKFVSLV